MGQYTPEPVFLIIDVEPKETELPIEAYYCVDEKTSDPQFKRTFVHLPVSVDAYEAEEVGVEHLLRDMESRSVSTLATRVQEKSTSLKCLVKKLKELSEYLGAVLAEDKKKNIPANHQIISNIQDIFNYLPYTGSEDMVRAFSVGTNDMTLALYLGNILRTTIALHDLINTKIPPVEESTKKDKDKEAKDGKENEDKDNKAKAEEKDEKADDT